MLKKKKTKYIRSILGVSGFAALEVRFTVSISPRYQVEPFNRPLAAGMS
jgi:hypothetical protein